MAHSHASQHAHHHDHTDIDWADMAAHLETQAELYTPLTEHALAWLGGKQSEPGLIVDAGSGPGVVSCMLADAFPGARVVAVDGSEPLLERARARAERLGVADRFGTITGELPDAMADLDYPADLIWASYSLHHLGDQQAALAAFAERLAVGGTLALVEGGLPTRFLPRDFGIGRPGLQARLDAVQEDWFSEMRSGLPGSVAVPEDWRALMSAAGLRPTGSRTFLLDLPAPAPDRARTVAADTFGRFRETCGDALDATDRATLDRLLDPDDKASVHHRPDLFVLAARTVHTAVRPA
ncbi:trans-aconitate 2-methyltransferase [Streptomyces sp. YS415]|uniref:class I SAM-dependent methyltransferase n=1 Tax=Streptomyces sp. YS415 TaxID=2944806 RepID=UPI002021C1DF|nr:class I SAM-dependent methyltransferase [Streptomyces sp. YS415]MCL7428277.1 class I SAM-dependent methyltransferase [Streptomyces sp. YS415]